MSYYLAIDSGGTKTDYLLADDKCELARVRTGTIKRMRTDAPSATRNLDLGLTQLSAQSGVPMSSIARTCIGTAGEAVALVTDWLREALATRLSGDLVLLSDVEIALDPAFQGHAGAIVIAGTGSKVAGRTSIGSMISAGGWGPMLADQGSGHRIGVSALRAAFLAQDEDRTTLLMEAIMLAWELKTVEQLIEFANRTPEPDFSGLTTLVMRCAEQGDEVAGAVLRHEGEELGYLALLVLRRLREGSRDPKWVPRLAFAGSIMEKVIPVRQALIATVRGEFSEVQVLNGVVDPLTGALLRARSGR